jgi:quinol monooxygenase YgiN
MAIIVMTWQNPPEQAQAKLADDRASSWRETVLKQEGLVEYSAFTGRSSGKDMAVDSFRTSEEAAAFLGSKDFSGIVAEMRGLGVTNIDVSLWDEHQDVPKTLRPKSG